MATSRRDKERKKAKKTSALDWAKQQAQKGPKCIRLPDEVSFWTPEPGVYDVDFMPFLAGTTNPRADEGFQHFEREYEAHRVPMPDGTAEKVTCNWKCFRHKCAVCDFMASPRAIGDQELLKSLRTSTRHLWLVNDKPGSKKIEWKVFETNHYNKGQGFGEMIADALNTNPEYADFTDLENGMKLRLTVKKLTGPGFTWNGVVRIDFLKRDYTYPDSVLDEAPCLDDMIVEHDFKEMKKVFDAGSGDNEEEQNGEAPRKKKAVEEDEDDSDEDQDEDEELDGDDDGDIDDDEEAPVPAKKKKETTAKSKGLSVGDTVIYTPDDGDQVEAEIVKISPDGTSLTLKDEDGDVIKAVSPDDVEKEEDEPEDELDDDDEELDDDDETPAPRKKGRR